MTGHDVLDLALVALLLGHALRGWREGALTAVMGLVGLLGGGALGLWAVPKALERWGAGLEEPLPAVLLAGGVIMVAVLGESLLGQAGARLRTRARGEAARRTDAALGAVISMLVVSVLVTLVAGAIRPMLSKPVAAAMNRSRVLPTMDSLTPEAAHRWVSTFTRTLGQAGFPRAFSGLVPEPVVPVQEPDIAAARTPGVKRAAASIVRIVADAESCHETHAGTGWVVSPARVVTNAHVVAGASAPEVQVTGTGPRLDAEVVAFDPDLDLAVLAVPDLEAPALPRSGALPAKADAVVAGFPQGGPYTVRAARVRTTVQAAGEDIHGGKGVLRQVYSISGQVLPGNSGGPLLTPQGYVAGTVFARSMVDHSTGYVLTDAATDRMLDGAASYRTPVPTGRCAKI